MPKLLPFISLLEDALGEKRKDGRAGRVIFKMAKRANYQEAPFW
jgi:hypothetical protein